MASFARPVRSIVFTLTAGLAALVVALAPASSGYASPTPSQLQSQMDALNRKLEPIIENYDAVAGHLAKDRAQSAKLAQQIAPLKQQVELAQSRVGAISAQMFMQGPGSVINAVLTSGSPTTFADQLAIINMMSRTQQLTVRQATAAVNQYNIAKQPLDTLIAKEQGQIAAMAKLKAQITSQLSHLQNLLTQAQLASVGPTGSSGNGSCSAFSGTSRGVTAARAACSQIGVPYHWGMASPGSGFDCSGLTMWAWGKAGVTLDHNAAEQYHEITHVSRSSLSVGDLVFYNGLSHVAMYIGGGNVIHAPHTGVDVQVTGISNAGSIYGYGRP